MTKKKICLEQNIPCFTLLELLIVISIISILAAVALPSLSTGRVRARQTYCANNLRQIAIGAKLYKDDHRQYPNPERFLDDMRPLHPYIKSLKVFICPGNPRTVGNIAAVDDLCGKTDYLYWSGNLNIPDIELNGKDGTVECDCEDPNNCQGGNRHRHRYGNGNDDGGNGNGNGNGGGKGGKGNGGGNGNNGGNGNSGGNNGNNNGGNNGMGNNAGPYHIDPSNPKFKRVLADKSTIPVFYDRCGPAHLKTINICLIDSAAVQEKRDMCDLWALDSQGRIILDSSAPFPGE